MLCVVIGFATSKVDWFWINKPIIHNISTINLKFDDKAAIPELYRQMVDGWNRGNGEAFAAPYDEDGVLVWFDGTYLKGRLKSP